jgi:uncharacterized protein (DUF433 family)
MCRDKTSVPTFVEWNMRITNGHGILVAALGREIKPKMRMCSCRQLSTVLTDRSGCSERGESRRTRPEQALRRSRCWLDTVYIVYDTHTMPTVVQSCRMEVDDAALLSRQAKRRHLEVSTLSSLYLKEKAIEEEFPGVGFRDSVGGREAYLQGHRVAVWEVADLYQEAKSIAKTAEHFRWPPALVRCALAYAKAYPAEIEQQRKAEVEA